MTADDKTWLVEYERENCIGAGACVAANSEYWSMDDEGLASLEGAEYDAERKLWVLSCTEEQAQRHIEAAEVCPVNVIHVISPDGERKI